MKKIDDYLNKIICGDCVKTMKKMPDNSIDLIVYKQLIESLEKQNNYLKQDKIKLYEQLEIKDKQLATKEEHTANLTRLLENSQVLLKQSQEKILLLENPPVEKIPDNAKSFWGKLNIFR
jgi:DNA modification methylase